MTSSSVRVRFAPSPTGYLHVGGARTALFNWLFARRHGGTFVLRIEDTDVERSTDEMVQRHPRRPALARPRLGRGPGASAAPYGPYFQSERLERYRAMAEQLVARGHAYSCYCTPEELTAQREAAQARGDGAWQLRPRCRPAARRAGRRASRPQGRPRAIRFRVPEGRTDLRRPRPRPDRVRPRATSRTSSSCAPTATRPTTCRCVVRRHRHADHPRHARRRPHLEHAEAGAALPGARRAAAAVRARAADPRPRQEAPQQAPRRDVGRRSTSGRATCPRRWSTSSRCSAGRPADDRELFTRDELIAALLASTASAAATPCSTPRSWTGSTTSTSMRLGAEDLAARIEPGAARGRAVARRVRVPRARPGSCASSRCCSPRAPAARLRPQASHCSRRVESTTRRPASTWRGARRRAHVGARRGARARRRDVRRGVGSRRRCARWPRRAA